MKEHIPTLSDERSPALRLLRSHKQGNALFPQVNMGVVGLVGHEIFELKPESLSKLLEDTPDMCAFEEVAKTMNARHSKYGVRPFEAEDVSNVYRTGTRMSVLAIGHVMGLNIQLDNPRALNALTHLINSPSPEATAVRQVFSHIAHELQGCEVAKISRQYRQLVSEKVPQSVQNELVRGAIDHMCATWNKQNEGIVAPFWYMEELRNDAPRGYMKFGQTVLPSQRES